MILISGLSGAGKSTVLHALEDAGYFCTDNLPLEMLRDWSMIMGARSQRAAVCLDARSGFTADAIRTTIEQVLSDQEWQLLFVEADDKVLQRRFSTVRRRHPYPGSDLMSSIRAERESLQPIRNIADQVLDSSQLTPYELADNVDLFRLKLGHHKQLGTLCTVMSFSYKHGLPPMADNVCDMRFLPNPHYEQELAPQTGRDEAVIDFLEQHAEVAEAQRHIEAWLTYAWPLIGRERKPYFTLAFGCSGGRHRSVYMAERIARWIHAQEWGDPVIQHRELGIIERCSELERSKP